MATTATTPYRNRGLYESSQDDLTRGYRPIFDKDASDLLTRARWRALLSDGRTIYSTFGPVAGAIHTKADYAIGQHWTPCFKGEDREWGNRAEAKLAEWLKVCNVRGPAFSWLKSLWLMSKGIDVDGDFVVVLTRSRSSGFPQFQVLEAHRVGTRGWGEKEVKGGRYDGAKMDNGVILNSQGRPIAYRILGSTQDKDRDTPASSVIHGFDPKWFSQNRGIPSIAYSVLDWYDVKEIREAEKLGVHMTSSIGLIEKNERGGIDTGNAIVTGTRDPGPINMEVFQKGLVRYFKAGSGAGLEAFTAQRPGATWNGFMDHILRGAFKGLDWPPELGWDMKGLTGPGVRFIGAQAARSVSSRQGTVEPVAMRCVLHAVASFIDMGELPAVDGWWRWGFTQPPLITIDSSRDMESDRRDYVMGMQNLEPIVQKRYGITLEEHLRQRARNEKLRDTIATEEGVDPERLGKVENVGNGSGGSGGGGEDRGEKAE